MKRILFLAVLVSCVSTSLIRAQNGTWTTYTHGNSGLASDTITTIGFDATNNMWLGTAKGLDQFNGTAWTSYYNDSRVPSNEIFDLTYGLGALWVAHGTGVTAYNGSVWMTFTPANSGLADVPAKHLVADNEYVWIGTQEGLNRVSDELDWAVYTKPDVPAMPANSIATLTVDKYQNIWMSFDGARGIVEYPAGNSTRAKFFNVDTISSFPSGSVSTMKIDGSGNIWTGMQESGVARINLAGAITFSKDNSPLRDNHVNGIAIDACSHVWVATDSGVAMYDGTSWTMMTRADGYLPNDIVNAIAADAGGHIWCGTEGGITEYKPLPQKPALTYPTNGATIVKDTVICRWTKVCPNITGYWYEFADNESFINSYIDTTSTAVKLNAMRRDTIANRDRTYYWRVKAKNEVGWGPFSDAWSFTPSEADVASNSEPQLRLEQNYPNPCANGTTITYSLAERANVSLKVYNMLGVEVLSLVNSVLDAGEHTASFNIQGLSDGVYVYRIWAGNKSVERVMQVMK